ncbi:MAG: TonB-dependent receptor [Bacteroidales bacterium]|nr:TonB-dependent receptor [Bacteroidales bacterium]
MKKQLTISLACILSCVLNAQEYHQTVRGSVIDKESHAPVPFATITLTGTAINKGVISDENGYFRFEKVPVGRVSLRISSVGYESMNINNLDVIMGKEMVVYAELVESTIQIDEVTIRLSDRKEKTLNTFAAISARTFAVEESQRYAGSGNDVSRMAMNLAGVKMLAETTNEIIIRGNSPFGLVFRLDGADIPNPSHFGDGSTTGGPVSMLNNNVLSNSDFLTGAFPAEYANAISGIFDLHMRNGNNEKHEFLVQAGLISYEFGAEGPISAKTGSSYLVNYRYSSLKALSRLGFNVMGSATPDYQDLSFKLNFPGRKYGTISLFGLGGISRIKMLESTRDTTESRQQMPYESDYEMDLENSNCSGTIGLSHSFTIGTTAYTKLILSASTIRNFNSWDSLSTENRQPTLQYYSDFQRTRLMARFYLNKKLSSKTTMRTGITIEKKFFSLLDSIYDGGIQQHRVLRNHDGADMLWQPYVQLRHRFNSRMQLNIGISSLFQTPNSNWSVEPRAGFSWEFLPGNTLNIGYGLHSMAAPIDLVNQKVLIDNHTYSTPNKALDFIKSHHFVAGYDKIFSGKTRIKAEIYYQYITSAAVEKDSGTYSVLNRRSYIIDNVGALVNNGTGYNYGIELTAEKFMNHGTYYLTTLSLYQSKYRGSDGILRNTAFNSHYVFNILGGKEFQLGMGKSNARFIKKLLIDVKINRAGGMRYTPVDLNASAEAGSTVCDLSNPFSEQLPAYFSIDLRAGMKFSGKRSTQEIAIDIRNLTNRRNPFDIRYDPETGKLKKLGFGMTPDILYRITF